MLFSVAGYLIYLVGWPILGGAFVTVLKIIFDMHLSNSNKITWEEFSKVKDKRVNLLNEALINIRMMKLYSWTDTIIANIDV